MPDLARVRLRVAIEAETAEMEPEDEARALLEEFGVTEPGLETCDRLRATRRIDLITFLTTGEDGKTARVGGSAGREGARSLRRQSTRTWSAASSAQKSSVYNELGFGYPGFLDGRAAISARQDPRRGQGLRRRGRRHLHVRFAV